jgi:protein TonB
MLSNSEQRERKSRIIAIAGTILLHALILTCLILLHLHARIPLRENESVQINFNYNNDSLADSQEQAPAFVPDSLPQPEQIKPDNQMITKNDDQSATIEKNTKKIAKPETTPVGKPTAIVETPHERTIIRKPDPGNTPKASSTVNQFVTRNPDEAPSSQQVTNTDRKLKGVSFDLEGRGSIFLQKPIFDPPVEGKIIVTIIVERQGKVIFASAGSKGTTISDYKLRQQAENAARKSLFAPDKNAPTEQRGTITYVFVK